MPVLSHLPILSYEIHLSEEVRRKGLGKFLMQTLELLAARYLPHGHTDVCLQFHSVAAVRHVVLCTSRVGLLCLLLSISCNHVMLLSQSKDEKGGLDRVQR